MDFPVTRLDMNHGGVVLKENNPGKIHIAKSKTRRDLATQFQR
jgi:hypothetical protein